MDITKFDNIKRGCDFLGAGIYDALAEGTPIDPIKGYTLLLQTHRENLERVYVEGEDTIRCFYLKDYVEIDFLTDASTLRLDLLAKDILTWVYATYEEKVELLEKDVRENV